jgi:hypothetical protein
MSLISEDESTKKEGVIQFRQLLNPHKNILKAIVVLIAEIQGVVLDEIRLFT